MLRIPYEMPSTDQGTPRIVLRMQSQMASTDPRIRYKLPGTNLRSRYQMPVLTQALHYQTVSGRVERVGGGRGAVQDATRGCAWR